ncbi:MAG: hypothetical protein ABSC46_00885 [Candidatus Limnocylindrales bacterium]|jgi:hypothetical protein
MLLAYDADGNVVATLDYLLSQDGGTDFKAHEAAGGKLRAIWEVSGAVGSGTWPEQLGSVAHGFKVELDKQKRIVALVDKTSGQRRERAAT